MATRQHQFIQYTGSEHAMEGAQATSIVLAKPLAPPGPSGLARPQISGYNQLVSLRSYLAILREPINTNAMANYVLG
ncbi:hypothetical protein N7490_003001 [Penicillium lividum]|nr:hypothetical protein N7490_003001 [Penicillium lividum]